MQGKCPSVTLQKFQFLLSNFHGPPRISYQLYGHGNCHEPCVMVSLSERSVVISRASGYRNDNNEHARGMSWAKGFKAQCLTEPKMSALFLCTCKPRPAKRGLVSEAQITSVAQGSCV